MQRFGRDSNENKIKEECVIRGGRTINAEECPGPWKYEMGITVVNVVQLERERDGGYIRCFTDCALH